MKVSIAPVLLLLLKAKRINVTSPNDAKKLSDVASCVCIEAAQWMTGRDLRDIRDYFDELSKALNRKPKEAQ